MVEKQVKCDIRPRPESFARLLQSGHTQRTYLPSYMALYTSSAIFLFTYYVQAKYANAGAVWVDVDASASKHFERLRKEIVPDSLAWSRQVCPWLLPNIKISTRI
jgi:hypothetical protein